MAKVIQAFLEMAEEAKNKWGLISLAGTKGGGIFLSTDGGTNWTAVNSGLTFKDMNVYSLAVSSSNIFAGTSGNDIYQSGGVFLSTDNGTNWTAVNSGLTTWDVYCLAVKGSNIFAGTKYGGVFLTTNMGASWTAVNSGLTNMYVYSLAIIGNNIFAGTFGSGVWRRPLSEMACINNLNPQLGNFSFSIHFQRQSNPNLAMVCFLPNSDHLTVKIFNLLGQELTTLVNKKFGAGLHNFNWDTRNLAPGIYALKLQTGLNTYVRSVPILR
jgi:hypothetical protein